MEIEEVIIKTEPAENFEDVENVKIINEDVETFATTTNNISSYALVYVCSICKKVFGDQNLLEHHIKIVHRPLTLNILCGAFCDICRKILDENVYNKHLPQCKTNYNSLPGSLNYIHERKLKKFECAICKKVSINLNKLSEHLRTVHRPITTNYFGKSTHSFCDTCKNLFKDDLFTHFPCYAIDVKCFFCLTQLPLKNHFNAHMLYWEGFRKFQCVVCSIDTKLMNFTELNEHIKLHNNGLGMYQCVKCKLHMDQSHLEAHYQKRHQGCKCLADPCCCEQYNEIFYLKHILKIDIPFANMKSTVKTQNKSIQTCTTACKNSCNSPDFSKSPKSIKRKFVLYKNVSSKPSSSKSCKPSESTPCLKVETKPKNDSSKPSSSKTSEISTSCIKVEKKPKNVSSRPSSSKTSEISTSCTKVGKKSKDVSLMPSSSKSSEINTSCTNLKNKSKTVLDDKPTPTKQELLEKDHLDKESFLRHYYETYVVHNFTNFKMDPSKLRTKRLTKHQLTKFKSLLMQRAHKKNAQKFSRKHAQLTEESNDSKIDEQTCAVKKEESSTSELMSSEIVKEEQTELLSSENIKNELQNLLDGILAGNDQQSDNVEQKCKNKEENLDLYNRNPKQIKLQRDNENSECQTINDSENQTSAEADSEELENISKISSNVKHQQEYGNSANIEALYYQVCLIDTDNENNEQEVTRSSSSGNEAHISQQKSELRDLPEDQASLNHLFKDLDDVENENSPESLDPDYLPGYKVFPGLENSEQGNDGNIYQSLEVCGICGVNFSSADLLNNHLTQDHRLRAAYAKRFISKTVFCAHCKTYTTQNHFPCKGNAIIDTCHFCTMSLPKKEHFELHNIDFFTYNKMFCTLCNDNTEYKMKTLNEHRIKEHKDIGAFECVICKDKFSSNTKLKEHLVHSKHKFDLKNSAEKYKLLRNHSGVLKYYKCKHCQRIFFSHHNINHHRCHKFDLCFVCGQTFKNPSVLKEHLNKHLKTKSYNCKKCDKTFLTRKHMVQHQKIHETNKEFKCIECSQTFTQQTSLIYHMATHTNENVFKCSVCDILFDKQSKLTAHMQIHNDNGTNPHKCDICNKLFSHKCKLLVHKRTHRENNKDK